MSSTVFSLLYGPCTCFSLNYTSFDEVAAEWFSECLFTWRERSSFYIGMTSLLFWILCQLPQMIKNYHDKSAEGLAVLLMVQWLCGDTMNLVGSILTQQLSFQKVSAGCFVCMDVILISQKFMYSKKRPNSANLMMRRSSLSSNLAVATSMIAMLSSLILVEPSYAFSSPGEQDDTTMILSCEPFSEVTPSLRLVGNILGWTSSCLYVGSRIAQIAENRKRQSSEGIASTMFAFAIMGNVTYSIGILLRGDRLVKAIPWLIGSLSCMTLDTFIVSQLHYYRVKARKEQRVDSLAATPEISIRRRLLESDDNT